MEIGINIGNSKGTFTAASAAIMEILNSDNSEEVKRLALGTLSTVCETPHNATLNGCSVFGGNQAEDETP